MRGRPRLSKLSTAKRARPVVLWSGLEVGGTDLGLDEQEGKTPKVGNRPPRKGYGVMRVGLKLKDAAMAEIHAGPVRVPVVEARRENGRQEPPVLDQAEASVGAIGKDGHRTQR